MAEINWGIINNAPNVFAMGLEGYQTGQQAVAQRQKQALVQRQADREEAKYQADLERQKRRSQITAGYGANPTQARQEAVAAGDFDLAEQFSKLDVTKREEIGRKAEIGAKVAQQLLGQFPGEEMVEQRKAAAVAMAPQLAQYGVTPEEVAASDYSTGGLQRSLALGMSVGEAIAKANADRDFGLRKSDTEHDNTLADSQFGETKRHNQVGEHNDATRLGYEGARVGMDRQRLGLEGQRVEIERGKAALTANGKPLPAPIQTGYLGNQQSIKQIDEAISALKAYPQSVGLVRGAGDGVNQRVDPRGVDARAKLANIGSLIIHDRAGASQTVNETKRLTPFVPGVTDGARAAIKKLETLRGQYVNENNGIEVAYGEGSGYRALPRSAAPTSGGPVRVNTPDEARRLPPGTRFITPDGREKVR
jgi:hypothetical protein